MASGICYDELWISIEYSKITVCDTAFDKDYEENGTSFIKDISGVDLKQFDCAFITTPTKSHFNILSKLIEGGMQKIFVEKPAVTSKTELNKIQEIAGDCNILTGYILRQSEPLFALKYIISKMEKEGFIPEFISVVYQKSAPYKRHKNRRGHWCL